MAINQAPTFNVGDGKLTAFTNSPYTTNDYLDSMLVQPDGKILLIGNDNNQTVHIFRFNPDGSPDTTFGPVASYGRATDAALDADDKILITIDSGGVVRYNKDGTLDTDFSNHPGQEGLQTINFSTRVLTVLPDGKILVGGEYLNGHIGIARLNDDGSLDATFGTDGIVEGNLGNDYYYVANFAVQTDGKIIVAAVDWPESVLVRYNIDGSLDTDFGTNGISNSFYAQEAKELVLLDDGKILLTSDASYYNDFTVQRFNTDGSLDADFGNSGTVTTNFGSIASVPTSDRSYSIALQDDGKFIVAGKSGGQYADFAMVRYNADGTIDSSFGVDGKVVTAFSPFASSTAYSVTVLDDGKILLAGDYFNSGAYNHQHVYALAKYNSDGSLDTRFDLENTLQVTANYTEDGAPVVIDSNAKIYDADLVAIGNYGGASLTLARSSGANAQDIFSAKVGGTLGALTANGQLVVDSIDIGTVNTNSNGTLVLTFNENATQNLVNATMQQIAYSNTSNTPQTSIQMSWTFSDGNVGAQGTGGSLAITGNSTVNIAAVNDAPVLSGAKLVLASGTEDKAYVLTKAQLLAGFTDAEHDTMNVSSLVADHGSVVANSNGTFTITPSYHYNGVLNLNYNVIDGRGGSTAATQSLNVAAVLDNPAVVTSSFLTRENINQAADSFDSATSLLASLDEAFTALDSIAYANITSESFGHLGGYFGFNNTFDIYGSNLTGYPATVTSGIIRLDSGQLIIGISGNLTVANENADVAGNLTQITVRDWLSKITVNTNTNIASDDLINITSLKLEVGSIANGNYSSLLVSGRLFEVDTEAGFAGTVNSVTLVSNGQSITVSGLRMSYADFDNYATFDDFLASALSAGDSVSGTAANDFLDGYAGADNIKGLAGIDTLEGGLGNDTLDGGAGNDSMTGGVGNDVYVVDGLLDVIVENLDEGNDTVKVNIATLNGTYALGATLENATIISAVKYNLDGNELDNFLTGNAVANSISGGVGDDTLVGGSGDDTLDGGLGNDSIDGGLGIDSMVGGAGDDVYVVDNIADKVIELGDEGNDEVKSSVTYTLANNVENLTLTGAAVINGTGNDLNNTIIGNAAANKLTGGSGQDTLNGAAGNDTLDGGTDADSMDGGAGNDTYVVDDSFDNVSESLGGVAGGVDTVQSSVDFTLADNLENLTLTGAENKYGTGNNAANTILGNSGNNDLTGAGGVDILKGGAGDDRYFVNLISVGAGVLAKAVLQDTVTENISQGNDSLMLTGGTITLTNATTLTLGANLENLDTFFTGNTKLNLTGNALDNQLIGNDANNILNGGTGADDLQGRAGNDIYFVDNVLDTVTEYIDQPGTDLVNSSVSFTLGDFLENLTLTGLGNLNGAGNDLNNIIIGTAGNNSLSGGAGADTLNGGAGNDTYLVDDIGDVIIDSAGIDTIVSSVEYTLALGLENLTLVGSADINGTGNTTANYIKGNAGYNELSGGAGNDTLEGGIFTAFSDTLKGGSGNDTYIVDDLTDIIVEESALATEIDTIQSSVNLGLSFYANIENLTLIGTDDINATGSDIANVLTGNIGNNELTGGLGIDTLKGGNGNDTYYVDLVAINNTPNATLRIEDTIIENAIEGSADSIIVNAGAFSGNNLSTITIGANIEKLLLDNAVDIKLNVVGNTLNNYVVGNNLANRIDGGVGNDDIYGNEGNDTLIGGLGNDSLSGNADNDSLDGGLGNDILDGDTGADILAGGAGNDVYFLDDLNDVTEDIIIELAGATGGIDTIHTTFTYSLMDTDGAGLNGGNVENLTLLGSDDINGTGNALANYLTGNDGNNSLMGGAGNDTLTGGIGSDLLVGGLGNDTYLLVDANDLLDTIIEDSAVGSGIDTVKTIFDGYALGANLENLVLLGTNDIGGSGNSLNNTITGNDYNNSLNGLDGNDTLLGGLGNDTLQGGVGNDQLNGGLGLDTASYSDALGAVNVSLLLAAAQNTVGAGVDTLSSIENLLGSSFNDIFVGNTLANDLNGAAGNDTLTGGVGSDTLTGGLGDDIFDFNAITESKVGSIGPVAQYDTITDFNLAGNDLIDLFTIDANSKLTGNQAFTFIGVDTNFTNAAGQLRFDSAGHMLYGDVDGNGVADFQIELLGVTTMDTTDFIL